MDLRRKSIELRRDILDIVHTAKAGHIGGDLSVIDILNVLYNAVMDITPGNFSSNDRDHFILSKGHCVEALYAVLADKGFFPREDLHRVSQFDSPYIGHPHNKIPGIEMNSGSLGHGLSLACGMALALKRDNKPHRVYVVMGDGELAEGSVWEGAMAAAHYGLDNLVVVVDRNGLQISGPTEEVMAQHSIAWRFEAFGWHTMVVDGNDTQALEEVFERAKENRERPTFIGAHTVKGCGVSFMRARAEWHHRVPTAEECARALEELDAKEAALYGG